MSTPKIFSIKFHPEKLNEKDANDTTMNEAIQTIYSFNEDLTMQWNDLTFLISLKGDVSVSWLDIEKMIDDLNSGKKSFKMFWASNTFMPVWEFELSNEDNLTITAYWSVGKKSVLTINRSTFLTEWERLKQKVYSDLKNQGYDLERLE